MIQESFWNHPSSGNDTYSTTPPSFSINSSDFNVSGGTLFVVFKSSSGVEYQTTCSYTITKTTTPSFSLTPVSQNIACGDTSSKTFTITPSNIPAGSTVTYSWNYSGWNLISQTVTSRTLQANYTSSFPSNVTVTPSINGVTYPQKTCTISLTPYSNGSVITGNSTICNLNSTSSYSLTSPPNSGITSVIWSSSNTAIATVSGGTTTGVTVNSLNKQGTITLSALISNSCGQTATKSYIIKVGSSIPSGIGIQKATGYLEICGNDYHYVFLEVVNPDTSQSSYTYNFSAFNTGIANPNVTYVQVSSKVFRVKIPKNKIPTGPSPTLVFNFSASNVCGASSNIYGKAITMDANIIYNCNGQINPTWRMVNTHEINEEPNSNFTIYPNPSSDLVYIDSNINNSKTEKQTVIIGELYDLLGKLQRKVQLINDSAILDVKGLTKGIYTLKIDNNGTIENHKIIVE